MHKVTFLHGAVLVRLYMAGAYVVMGLCSSYSLTHLYAKRPIKKDIGKQCRLRSDAAEIGVWSESPLFVFKYKFERQSYLP